MLVNIRYAEIKTIIQCKKRNKINIFFNYLSENNKKMYAYQNTNPDSYKKSNKNIKKHDEGIYLNDSQ